MNYNNYLPKSLNDYNDIKVIEYIKKIDFDRNLIIYGNSGYGKSYLKKLILERYKENNKFLKIINLNLDEDLKKTNDCYDYINNILKLSQKKIFIIDNISHIDIKYQILIKSILKKHKNINFLIFLNNITNLIENFYSFFIFFKLDNIFFTKNMKNIVGKLKNDIKISKTNINYILKSSNFYELKKICTFFLLFNKDSSNYISDYKSITSNNNKILYNILKNDLNKNIKYINELLNKGFSEVNIINFIIYSLYNNDFSIKNRNIIIDKILKIELNRISYSYIDLLYIVKILNN